MPVDPNVFRATMRQWATGVTIVTTAAGADRAGMTVSSFTSVSLEPPTVLVCLNKTTHCHDLVLRSNVFAISLLASDQEALSNRFAGLDPAIADRFEGLEPASAETGSPLLPGAVAWLDCRVSGGFETSTHSIFLGAVVYARVETEKIPLLYYNRAYGHFAASSHEG